MDMGEGSGMGMAAAWTWAKAGTRRHPRLVPYQGAGDERMIDPRAFQAGWDAFAWRWMGAHRGPDGVRFTVWAPNASRVSVVGDFNAWAEQPLEPIGRSGIWSVLISGASAGQLYKFRITNASSGETFEKADPFAFRAELAADGVRIDHSTHR